MRLPALVLALLAALAIASPSVVPAHAADGYQPDQQVVADVWSYAQETDQGYDHVLRWMRALVAFDELDAMTAAEAQGYADNGWQRWEPVAAELTSLENDRNGYDPDQQVVADVESYARETGYGYDHVLRWMRALKTLGAMDDMTAAEAQGYADGGWQRWVPVAAELAAMEASISEPDPTPTPESNRAPVVDTEAPNYAGFAGAGPAPRGVLVTKPFEGIFSDPDGDGLIYFISAVGVPDSRISHDLAIIPDGQSDASVAQSDRPPHVVMRVWFEADAEADWDALDPPMPENPVVTFELTAVDPQGLTASVAGSFRIPWEPEAACEPVAPSSVTGVGIERAAVISWTLPESRDGACEVSGFVVGATDSNGVDWETRVDDPEARKHVLRGLEPGDYRFYVRTEHPTGTSDEFRTSQQNNVPALCDIVLSVEPYGPSMISGRWHSVSGMPSGCVWGPHIEFQVKRSEDDYFHMYGLFSNWPQTDPDLPSFIMGNLQPYVSYDFRIAAVDAAGQKNESNVATAMIVSKDPSVTPDDNSPGDVRVRANNNSGIFVSWEAPASLGAGRTFNAWVVEWKTADGTATDSVAISVESRRVFRINGLTDGTSYVVRVAARTTGAGGNRDAWSAPAPALTAWSEPTQIWFSDRLGPTPNFVNGRVWMDSASNKALTASRCFTNDGMDASVPCPPHSLVSLEADADTEYTLRITGSVAGTDENNDGADDSITIGGWEGFTGGPRAPGHIRASGGNNKVFVEWSDIAGSNHVGTLDAYVIQHRQGTSGAWTNVVVTDTTARSHTVTGVANGFNHQVRVRGRSVNTEDHDGDPNTPVQAVHRLGFTSEVLTVRTHILWVEAPRHPTSVRVRAGEDDRTLTVTWEHPDESDRSKAHAYQVRHREQGTSDWTESDVLYPRRTHRICDSDFVCENPRSYVIEGLIGGRYYEVAVRARNANGWGEWLHDLGFNIPNGLPPAVSSAAASTSGLSITFDRALGANSPPASAFTVKATSGTATRTISVSSVQAVAGKVVSLSLSTALAAGETVTISYTKPETNPLVAATGEEVESFTDQTVTNSTPP